MNYLPKVLVAAVIIAAFGAAVAGERSSRSDLDSAEVLMHSESMTSGIGGKSMHELHHGGASVTPKDEASYLVDMIPHHEEAIRAARQLLAGTEREEMAQFAREIIRVQSAEVDVMRTWLAQRHPTVDTTSAYMAMMRNYDGMTGDELDQAFLVDMIPHHMTAIMMSRQLIALGLAEHDDVVPFAETIATTQSNEVTSMRTWLFTWFPGAEYGMMNHG
jgi:uncharacterized protein (DUF305 family)